MPSVGGAKEVLVLEVHEALGSGGKEKIFN